MYKTLFIAAFISILGNFAFGQAVAGNERGGLPGRGRGEGLPPPSYSATLPTLKEMLSPFQQWSALGSKARGLMVIDTVQGIPLLGGYAGENTYKFIFESDSPVVVYFPSKGEGFNFMKDWQVPNGNGYVVDVAQFGKSTPNPWGLSGDLHIVDVEVNGGKGGGATIHFVASTVTLGDADQNFQPSKKLNDFLRPYSDITGPVVTKIASHLDKLVAEKKNRDSAFSAIKTDRSQGTTDRGFTVRLSSTGDYVTFVFYMSRNYGTRNWVSGNAPPHCGPGQSVTQYGAEFARSVIIDKNGNIISQGEITRSYVKPPTYSRGACMPLDPPRPRDCHLGQTPCQTGK